MADKNLKAGEKEKKLIPVMILKYCKGNHRQKRKAQGVKGKDVCEGCKALTEYALLRLEKCPFKINKQFCTFCTIHCYKPEMREEIRKVMKYSGPRMIFSHPVFAISHAVKVIKYKKTLKRKEDESIDR